MEVSNNHQSKGKVQDADHLRTVFGPAMPLKLLCITHFGL